MRHIIRILLAHVFLLGALFATPAWALILPNVTASGSVNSVALGQPTVVTVVWVVTRQTDGNGGNCGATVSSTVGTLRGGIDGTPLLGIPTTLTQTQLCPSAPLASTPFTFTETIVIPADAVRRAQLLGSLSYTRNFDDGFGGNTGALGLLISSSATGPFGVVREALAFDNGAPARVLTLNEPLGAVAELTFSGTGLLQAQWEIAGPESTSGTPVFRVLSQVRQYLISGDTHVFRSPPLPTDAAGLHFVRLRVTDPTPGFEAPVIRYFVLQSRADRDTAGRAIALGAPPPRALLAPDTAFSWEAIRGARAYQLEIYDTGQQTGGALPDLDNPAGEPRPSEVAQALSRPAVTGMFISGSRTRAVLSPTTRQHLLPGRRYLWRVLAIGQDGSVVGVSPMRELRTL